MNTKNRIFKEASLEDLEEITSGHIGDVLKKSIVRIWQSRHDRQIVASFLGRYSAHVGILLLALFLTLLGRVTFAQVGVAEVSQVPMHQAVAEPVQTPTPRQVNFPTWQASSSEVAISRRALPKTDIPERVRLEVITYTVQTNDTVWGIAEAFGLQPSTIVWSNMEALQGAPWLLQPGLTLEIPPVDGAYHTVAEDETVADIASAYDVEPQAIYNQWNDIQPGASLKVGLRLVIPNGVGEDFDWEPPPPPASSGVASADYSYGFCGDVSVSGPGANGWFILPTGSSNVSGWFFRDPRKPPHNGLDYKCYLGDAIYAADNGVVVYAGWASGYGNLVKIDHGNGYMTYYAHLDSVWVGCGQAVYQGTVVGPCGTTGWSTGPHLHYEIRRNGVPQNPKLYEP
jgi:murein DD-endopeptidase MepM/ murein hydrolase activator NlpD